MEGRYKLLLESPRFQEETVPIRSTRSSSLDYILHIAPLPSYYAASASFPSNVIDIFDKISLRGVQTLPGHEEGTTSLHTVENLGGGVRTCLVSSGKDGSVKVWDDRDRLNSHSIKLTNSGNSGGLLCCDVSFDGLTVAAGTDLEGDDALIQYWDPRQPAVPLRVHSSTHSDDITTLSFHPEGDGTARRNIILSGSSDGLLCTSYADEDDEEEAIVHVGNLGSSISQAGWIHGANYGYPDQAGIWAATDMETFSTWTRELDQLISLDIRAPELHGRRNWSTDYLITAHSSTTSTPNLAIFTGNNTGDVAFMSGSNISVPETPWCLHKLWRQGHDAIVRALFWDESNQVLVTGGEDSKLNTWVIHPIAFDDDEESDDAEEFDRKSGESVDGEVDVDMGSPRQRKRDSERGHDRKGKRAKLET